MPQWLQAPQTDCLTEKTTQIMKITNYTHLRNEHLCLISKLEWKTQFQGPSASAH